MSAETLQLIRISIIFIPLVLLIGLYCILVTNNLIRILIGLELLTKAVTLLIILAGYAVNRVALAQSLAITLIVIEVVVVVVAAGVVINVFANTDSLDAGNLKNLKG